MTDPLGDMFTRLRNAQMIHHDVVVMPYSNFKHRLADILVREGYLGTAEKVAPSEDGNPPLLQVHLKYDGINPAIRMIRRISTPGRRVYASAHSLPYVYDDLGLAIISTSRGLMTNKQARAERIGGEILCEVF